MPEALRTICRACGKTFFASFEAVRDAWPTAVWTTRAEWCTHCGERRTYERSDYFFS